ncbi:cupin domain-containing protein [Chamaesiphon sp. VAR_69_metabat_338]|uniref:cupin domain-containing protein n=1 Tax=Chamaesiphon sp. VAR_69_metabat_338 TaxID=2964704 RepID=UPI00286D76BC|nr:cupin domain-containing protein [Chamaesiphon sp. VAR_69_metabat_338]
MSPPPLSTTVIELIDNLQLQPHPEGGFYRETWRSDLCLPSSILPADYSGSRSAGTAILFLLPTGHSSRWHRVRSAELWFHQAGDPLELGMAATLDEESQVTYLGRDYCWQAVVPPHHWQRAQPIAGKAGYALVACVVVPGFDFADFEMSDS